VIFQNLVSWSLVIGFVIGFLADRTYHLLRACWLDKHRPRADGKPRSKWQAIAVDPRALAAVVAILFLGWSVYQTQANTNGLAHSAEDAHAFADRVQDCQQQLIEAIALSRELSADNDRLSLEERSLLADVARLQATWIGQLIDPPGDLKNLDPNAPARQTYGIAVSRDFFTKAGHINDRIEAIHDERNRNDRSRPPLPAPNCGDK
jgi:hypothetical protein